MNYILNQFKNKIVLIIYKLFIWAKKKAVQRQPFLNLKIYFCETVPVKPFLIAS